MSRYGALSTASPDVHISSRNGTVTLTGTVSSEKDRQMLETLTRNTPGVLLVDNQLHVAYPPTGLPGQSRVFPGPPPAPIVATPAVVVPGTAPGLKVYGSTASDRRVCDDVVERLRSDSIYPAWTQDMTLSANDGDVHLQGYVRDRAKRDAIVAAVQQTPGVRTIYDELHTR
jgi:osmotically-inducible protein OsmY